MQPEQPAQPAQQPTAPPPSGPPSGATPQTAAPVEDRYAFIMDPSKPPRKRLLNGGAGNSMAVRLLIVVAGVFVLLVIFVFILKALGGDKGTFNKAAMLSVAQDQAELVHLSTGGVQNSVSQDNKNFSITTQLSSSSQQAALLTYLQSHGYKPGSKQLALKQSAATDSQLSAALTASTFDPTYREVMKSELETYQKDLSTAYNTADSKAKALLSADYNGAGLLLEQLSDTN